MQQTQLLLLTVKRSWPVFGESVYFLITSLDCGNTYILVYLHMQHKKSDVTGGWYQTALHS